MTSISIFLTAMTETPSSQKMIMGIEGLRPPVRKLYDELIGFLDQHVYPNEKEIMEQRPEHERWTVHPLLEQLKVYSNMFHFLLLNKSHKNVSTSEQLKVYSNMFHFHENIFCFSDKQIS